MRRTRATAASCASKASPTRDRPVAFGRAVRQGARPVLETELAAGAHPKAVVGAVQLPAVTDGELASSIAELERLARTLGLEPIARITQRRHKLASGVVLGEGKLHELARWTGGTGVVPTYVKPGSRKASEAENEDAADTAATDDNDDADEGEDETAEEIAATTDE